MPPGPPAGLALGLGQPVLLIGGAWLGRYAVRRLKEKITYPRTGYVLYRSSSGRQRWMRAGRSAGIGALVAIVVILVSHQVGDHWVPAISGGLFCLAMLLVSARMGLVRFLWLGVAVALIGILTTLLDLPTLYDTALFFGLFGLAWLASGGLTLLDYLRNTQPLPEGE
ncbi:MAG: hypothetical protein GYA17_08455 [Chloroflexi bacterium]|nr:hypothetical protein [Chloroflexota bacterium]